MDVNQRQYQLILNQGLIPKERLDQAYIHPNRRIYNDFIEFLIHAMLLRADIALNIRQQSLQPPPTSESPPSSSQLMSPADFEQLYLRAQHSSPLFSPHARVQFKLLEKLGEGGMGVVHRIEDKKLGRNAALKVLGNIEADERAIARFVREARITASLVHPNIPPIYELGMNSSGEHYMLMKVIEGQSLRAAIKDVHKEGKADPKEIRRLLEALVKVCEAMAYAHSKNVIHRDLKPENIMIGEFGEVMVLDWGLARDLSSEDDEIDLNDQKSMRLKEAALKEGLTGAGDLLGTVGYMAPEQIDGQACKQSDVFALGAILTEILSGKKAIEGEGAIAKLSATIQGRIHGPRALSRAAPKELNALAIKAMAMTRKNRVAGVEELVQDLKAYLEGAELTVYRYGLVTRSQRWVSRHPTFVSAAALLMALGFVGVFFQTSLEEAERQEQFSKRAEERSTALRNRLEKSLRLFDEAESQAVIIEQDQVKKRVEEALELGGRGESPLLRAASIYKKAELFAEAREIVREIETKYPPAYEALYLEHLIEIGDKKNQFLVTAPFAKLVSKSKERGEENEFTLMYDAFVSYQSKNWEEVVSICDKVEKLTRNRYELYMVRGNAKTELKRHKAAIDDYDQALILYSNNPIALQRRGRARMLLKDYGKAQEDFGTALAIDPLRVDCLLFFGEIARRKGDKNLALFYFNRMCEIEPQDWNNFANRGQLRTELGQYKLALQDYERAMKLSPGNALLYSNIGQLYYELGQPKKALDQFLAAVEQSPTYGAGYAGAGKAYLLLNSN